MNEETKAKVDRLRAKRQRGDQLGVSTKLVKEAGEIVKIQKEYHITRSKVIYSSLSEKLRTLVKSGKLSALRYVYDKISVHVRGLTTLGISPEQYSSLLIPVIMSKLPNDIRLEVARRQEGIFGRLVNCLK